MSLLILLLLLIGQPLFALGKDATTTPTTRLENGHDFPLCGMGVGNLQHELIVSQISSGVGDAAENQQQQYRLIDTAHASQNEALVYDGVMQGLAGNNDQTNVVVHVITKIWYTYLGYERTKISVRESLSQLQHDPRIRVHILIHWPRCNNDIPWMKCEEEEAQLPNHVKQAGPPPHLDKANAFKESWRALEDLFLGKISPGDNSFPQIESIGVSNFDLDDLKELAKSARVLPHILQGNVWSFVFDPFLIHYCQQHHIHFQAYNVMNGVFGRPRHLSARAWHALELVAQELSSSSSSLQKVAGTFAANFTAPQVVLKWLVQHDVSVIPRTTRLEHLHENSPISIQSMPNLNAAQESRVKTAVAALLRGQDLDRPQAKFVNNSSKKERGGGGGTDNTQILHLYWKNTEDGTEHAVRENLLPGQVFETSTTPGHIFVAYDHAKVKRKEFTIGAGYGEMESIHIDDQEL